MVLGIAMSTTILYSAMSSAYGQHVTTYINGRPDIFNYGMKVTFFGAFLFMCCGPIDDYVAYQKQGGFQKHSL